MWAMIEKLRMRARSMAVESRYRRPCVAGRHASW
jgi:hypothetical protein